MRCSHHYWMHRAWITWSIRTSTSGRGWASQRTPRNTWCPLSLPLSTQSNDVMSRGVASPCLCIGHSLIQTSHQIICFAGTSWRLGGFLHPSGVPPSSGFHLLFHYSIHNSLTAFLNSTDSCFYLYQSSGLINWTCQTKSNVSGTPKGKPLFMWSSSKEQYSFPQC